MADSAPGNSLHPLLRRANNGRPSAQPQRELARPPPNGFRGPHAQRRAAPRQFRHAAGGPGSRNTNFGPRPLPPLQATPAVTPPGWSFRKSVTIVLRPIPQNANPWNIREFLQQYGNVVWVELDDRGGHRSARVRFEPPPTDANFFYQGRCRLDISGSVSICFVEFPRQSPEEPTLLTPVGNTCPASIITKPEMLIFGLMTQPMTFMRKKEIFKMRGDLELKLTADFRKKKLVIHFPIPVHGEQHYYRVDIKFGIIKTIHRTTSEGRSSLVICVHDPPLVRKKQTNVDGTVWADQQVWGEDELWCRAVNIRPERQNPKAQPVSLDEQADILDLGRWTTYWMDLDKSDRKEWLAIESHLQDWNIHTTANVSFTQTAGETPELWNMLDDPQLAVTGADSNSWNRDLALLSPTAQISLPYDVRYQLEVCISHGILSEYNIKRDFLERLLEVSTPTGLDLNRARLALEYAADQGQPIHDPMSLLQDRGAMTYYPATLHIPDYCALIRKVTVTPTKIYFNTPTVETTNRIVRRYKHVQDHFIRVQFTDELLEGRVRTCEADRDDEVYTRVYRVMTQGIRMGKWHWKFLAFGNSQIRENGAFFFCEPDDGSVTCDSIRRWMGNFEHISSVAKYAARLGQCFSTTRLLHCISKPRIVKIPDVEKHGFCFTDGVGKISHPLACLIADDWKIFQPPSAVQFRMGGCKGVLVTWPDAKGTEVHVRPSQEKFSAEYNGLEIIRCSQYACATLNRQTILILSCLGVPDEVFTDMMATQIANYDMAMTDERKAVELLTSYVDENMTSTTIASMVLNGFMHTREPFVRTLLQLWRAWSIKGLKEKARLIVDQGAFVLGCVDETGTLRGHSKSTEGQKVSQDELPQIFLQVPDPKNRGAYKVITGLCLVGRNPSLHPGDIRVVEAVDVPQLRHLRDVVVFPLKGERDIPSMCSGGDLDGDDFFVIWNPKLLPTEWSHPPMNYSAPQPLTETRASTAKSLASFFVLFMKNDRLPLIAHAHLATADREVQGAKHWKCLELAQLHSTAVDYVKTGVPAEWNKKLDPRRFPHFMEKAKSRSYNSTSVLGKLYDMVKKEVFDNRENYKLPFDDRILKRYPVDHKMMKEARKIKTQYDIAMRRIMGQLEIRTEFEVWTTFVTTKPRVGTDYKVQEKVGREAAGLKKQFRDLCLKTAEEHGFDKLEFIAAMYKVTWEETRIALYEARQPHILPDGTVGLRRVTARSMPLISFPWLFSDDLGRIALGTERLPNLSELGINLELPTAKPKKPRDGNGVQDADRDLAGMDYTKTSDGQYVHCGEILHLFRHNDDNEESFYDIDDASAGSPADSPADSGTEAVSEGDAASVNAPTDGKGASYDFPLLLELEAALDGGGGDTSTSSPSVVAADAAQSLQLTEGAIEPAVFDLMSSDTGFGSDLSPWLTPVKLSAAQQQEEPMTRQQEAGEAEQCETTTGQQQGTTTAQQHETTTTQHQKTTTAQRQKTPEAQEAARAEQTPSTDVASEQTPAAFTRDAQGQEEEKIHPDNPEKAESVLSDSNTSWDRVTTPHPDSPVKVPSEVGSDPVEYINLMPAGGGGFAGFGFRARPVISSAELWGHGGGSLDSDLKADLDLKTGLGSKGNFGSVDSGGVSSGAVSSEQGQNQGDDGQGCQSGTRKQSQAMDQSQNQSQSLKPSQTALTAVTDQLVSAGEEDKATGDTDESDMEFEEDVIEVVGETVLERAARFA